MQKAASVDHLAEVATLGGTRLITLGNVPALQKVNDDHLDKVPTSQKVGGDHLDKVPALQKVGDKNLSKVKPLHRVGGDLPIKVFTLQEDHASHLTEGCDLRKACQPTLYKHYYLIRVHTSALTRSTTSAGSIQGGKMATCDTVVYVQSY